MNEPINNPQAKMTTHYDMFTFRNDNRGAINQNHVEKLKRSISTKNLLHLAPIIVNTDMEIINGQHRLLAAKDLRVPIYYVVQQNFKPTDMLAMNTSMDWTNRDIFNFYCKNGYIEYEKLDKYIKETGIPFTIAIKISLKSNHDLHTKFREGNYVFEKSTFKSVDIVQLTIDKIKKEKGVNKSVYSGAGKFWQALLKLVNNPDFNIEKWFANLEVHIERMTIKATTASYYNLFVNIYNWRNYNKIIIDEDRIHE